MVFISHLYINVNTIIALTNNPMNLLFTLILIPIVGIFLITNIVTYSNIIDKEQASRFSILYSLRKECEIYPQLVVLPFGLPAGQRQYEESKMKEAAYAKQIALIISIINLIISFVIFISFNTTNQGSFNLMGSIGGITLGIDGQNIFFVLLTTLIIPIVLLSNWNSITVNVKAYLVLILLLETLLLFTFLVVDLLNYYVFFESTLIPLFLLIGLFGSTNKIRASYYLFLMTLFGSLFMLLSILVLGSIAGTTDFNSLYKLNLDFNLQKWLFLGFMLAFSVKTPLYGVHTWLLKAHVEAPLGVSVLLAAIVLKLGLYGIIRILLPILPEACVFFTPFVYTLCVISIIYGSLSTLRTTDVKEIIAYSSVCHASVYVLGVFSNTTTGIEGGILLSLAHGFVSSGLFIAVGGVLYDRTGSRSIFLYRGMAQCMPIFAILFFILLLANCGTPLTFNFVGEFMSLYGAFERLPLAGALACSSIVFSAAYSIYMFNRIVFGGSYSLFFKNYVLDLSKIEFFMLFSLVLFTIALGIYPSIILDSLHYASSSLIYQTSSDFTLAFFPLLFRPVSPLSFLFSIKRCIRANKSGLFKTANMAVLFYSFKLSYFTRGVPCIVYTARGV